MREQVKESPLPPIKSGIIRLSLRSGNSVHFRLPKDRSASETKRSKYRQIL
ncbi:hypothetical protein CWATWH0003_1525 [Crocosphaera watsonii WH 0003]|uniref:Uncharacterized protein n=1 Tax=Crocosphaera watsonii WH 0003 TaxID=423471 RepID=G5J1Z4_CROWT|nr:hypothetical protein CWATWH0003_1525 [Crocosphaera watsonii WH 0003]